MTVYFTLKYTQINGTYFCTYLSQLLEKFAKKADNVYSVTKITSHDHNHYQIRRSTFVSTLKYRQTLSTLKIYNSDHK